jgi:hypothetical protein
VGFDVRPKFHPVAVANPLHCLDVLFQPRPINEHGRREQIIDAGHSCEIILQLSKNKSFFAARWIVVYPSCVEQPGALPYTDTKPVGAADFYFAIDATFRFILNKFGFEGLRQYWTDLGTHYFAPVSAAWKKRGLPGVADYWKAFFAAEPGADVQVISGPDAVTLEVKTCPAIRQLRAHGREMVPCFCQHCYFISEAMAGPAGLTVRIEGGNGSCRQTFLTRAANPPPQDFSRIKEATC